MKFYINENISKNAPAPTPRQLNSPSQRGVLSVDLSSAVPPATNPRRGTGGSLVDPGAHSCMCAHVPSQRAGARERMCLASERMCLASERMCLASVLVRANALPHDDPTADHGKRSKKPARQDRVPPS